MLGDLDRKGWLSALAADTSLSPEALVLRGTRNLRYQRLAYSERFRWTIELTPPNGLFEDVFVGEHRGVCIGYASVYGGAMASEITHLFAKLGVRLVVQNGCFGALSPDTDPGELFLMSRAQCGEGSSRYYVPDRESVCERIPRHLIADVEREVDAGCLKVGNVYTTGALLAQTSKDTREWALQGYSGVDMETASTFAVADHFDVDRISLLFAFENLSRRENLLFEKASDVDERLERANAQMIDLSLEWASRVDGHNDRMKSG